MPQIIIGPGLKKLDGSLQKATYSFLAKLAANDTVSGLHIEPIKNSADPRARTGRIGTSYRAVLFKLQGRQHDASYVFAGTYPHDEAIKVAQSSKIHINPRNGVAELIPVQPSPSAALPRTKTPLASPAPQRTERSLREREYTLEDLTTLGFDAGFAQGALELVGAEAVLEYAEDAPASWQGNALLDLYTGESFAGIRAKYGLEEPVSLDQSNDEDVLTAMQHPAARMEFEFVEDSAELRAAIAYPNVSVWSNVPGMPVLPRPPRSDRWGMIGIGVAVSIIVAAIIGSVAGWAMRGSDSESTSDSQPAISANRVGNSASPAFTEEEARQRACDAYRALSPEWAAAHREWLPVVSRPGWQWSDPYVRDATTRFRGVSNDVPARISMLIPANTPADVVVAINGYTGAILTYETDLGWQAEDILNAHARAINQAAAVVGKVCAVALE